MALVAFPLLNCSTPGLSLRPARSRRHPVYELLQISPSLASLLIHLQRVQTSPPERAVVRLTVPIPASEHRGSKYTVGTLHYTTRGGHNSIYLQWTDRRVKQEKGNTKTETRKRIKEKKESRKRIKEKKESRKRKHEKGNTKKETRKRKHEKG